VAHIRKSIVINAPLEKVHGMAADPKRWATWYVGLGEPEKMTGQGEVGTVVEMNYLMAGVRLPIANRVEENSVGPEGARWRATVTGAMTGEHTWTYTPKGDTTEVTSDTRYEVPGGVLGRIADRLIIERMQERAMEQTLENLKLICESS